jgi:hypothetical protein
MENGNSCVHWCILHQLAGIVYSWILLGIATIAF